ncbi:MAG: DNRLRE domain-containing protein, partial [Anaerolineae bacterium]
MTKKRIVQSVVLLALLIAASLAVAGLWSRPAALAQSGEPPTGTVPQATPPPGGVDPFEMTLTAHKDSWVDQAHPDTNHGAALELHLNPGSHIGAHTLLSFDLSALPPGATIVDATLAVYSDDTASDPYPILSYAITSVWKESLVTWNNKPSTSQRGDPASQHVPEGWTEFDVSNIVQEWYDGSLAVYGIALIPEAAASGERIYQANNSATPPVLTVHYTRRTELVAVADTWVEVAHPSLTHGSHPTLNIASPTFSGQEAHALLAFDFASLPADIDIISATLSLFSVPNQALAEEATLVADLYADAILGAWSESATTWNNAPASLPLGDPATQLVVSGYTPWDVTNIVQSWADGDLDAYGILLRASTATSSSYGFWSRDLSAPPRLVIAYGAAPPDCNPITSVQISGASAGVTGVAYTFDSVYFPADADPPDNIVWSATDQGADHYGSSVTFTWDSPGEKEVYVDMSHCGGTTSTSHTITISDPDPGCDYPLADVSLGGPMVVAKNTAETFAAGASPSNATLPITFLWEATDQAPETMIVSTRTTYKDYIWPTAGSKTISVTAENCAGSATAYQAVQVVDPVNLPDLFISTAWIAMDEGRIYYVIHNGGNTAVPAGIYVALKVGLNTVAVAEHPQPLSPGGLGVGYLDYAWTCAGSTASVAVEADWREDIAETDESNNDWTSTWTCDQRPPEFLTGPEVVDITETRVRVHWTMDEACVGLVEYDTSVYDPVPFQEQASTAYLTSHDVTLTGLTAGTTYYARALCEDAAGLGVNSEAVTFDTAPPGSDPPVIHTLTLEQTPHAYYEFWQAVVEVEDGSYMDRVTCSLDGTSLGVDYSPDTDGAYPRYLLYLSPYDLGLTRAQVFGQPHQLTCTAYRQDPSAFTTQQQTLTFPGDPAPPPYLWIEEPHPGYTIYVPGGVVPVGTQLDVVVSAAAHEWACTASGFSDDLPPGVGPVKCSNLAPLPVDSVELWFDGALKDTVTPGPSDTVHTLTADLTAVVPDDHEIRVAATVGARTAEDSRSLIVEQGQPGVEVSRSVRREGNLLEVTL